MQEIKDILTENSVLFREKNDNLINLRSDKFILKKKDMYTCNISDIQGTYDKETFISMLYSLVENNKKMYKLFSKFLKGIKYNYNIFNYIIPCAMISIDNIDCFEIIIGRETYFSSSFNFAEVSSNNLGNEFYKEKVFEVIDVMIKNNALQNRYRQLTQKFPDDHVFNFDEKINKIYG